MSIDPAFSFHYSRPREEYSHRRDQLMHVITFLRTSQIMLDNPSVAISNSPQYSYMGLRHGLL